jgi:transcription-repair coupling factor (superfamily II helicase)
MNVKDKYYIGSTEDIDNRITNHKEKCYNINSTKYNLKVYKYIRENCCDWSEVSFDILDVYDDISDDFKFEMEQYYMDYFSNNLNMKRAKYDKNIENKKRRNKYNNDEEYRNKLNEDRRNKYKNDEEYRNKICEKQRLKLQNEEFRNKTNEKKRLKLQNDEEYRNKRNENRNLKYKNDEEYRNKINEKKKEKIICECGLEISKSVIARHRKSKKHQELLNK